MKYSIIIPAYNVEKFINRCIDSILFQMISDVEVIVVNDGSTDKTLDCLKEYDSNLVKVIDIPNGGVSNARNIGLSCSNGEFIIFIDADDYLCRGFFESLKHINLKRESIYVFNYQETNGESLPSEFISNNKIVDIDKNKIIEYCTIANSNPYQRTRFNTVTLKIFSRDCVENLKFDRDLEVGEDSLFFLEASIHSKDVIYVDINMYCYYININSATHTYRNNMYENEVLWQQKLSRILDENNINRKAIIKNYCVFKGFLNCLSLNVLKNEKIDIREKALAIRELIDKPLYKNIKINREAFNYYSIKDKVLLILIDLKLYYLLVLIYELKSNIA